MSGPRTIVSLMGVAMVVALIGHTAEPTASPKALDPIVGDGQIIAGTAIATVILTLLSSAGEVGEKFATGVSLIVLLSAVGVYGSPLLKAIDTTTGQVTPKGAAAAAPTAPTKGT